MKRRWLAALGAVNIIGILYAAANQLVTIAILDPERIQFDLNDVRSIKMAIGRAESHGVELMRSIQLSSVAVLASLLIVNFLALSYVVIRTQKSAD